MVAHGLSSAGLFLAFGFMYQRLQSREMSSFGGVAKSMPILTTFFVLFGLSNIGLPGTGGFVGEIMVIMASFHVSMWLALAASLTLVLSASYTLWMIKQVFYGRITNIILLETADIDLQEAFVLSLLALGVLILGCYPEILISYTHQSCLDLIETTIGHH